jgi:uncharacterized protein (TIGR02147 family)
MAKFDFRDLLIREFEKRKSRNAKYSLRAYARDLGLQASKLSQILKGDCGLSVERGKEISKKLNLSDEERKLFLTYLEAHFSRSALVKSRAKEKLTTSMNELQIALEQFRIISDWYHFAIIELLKVTDLEHSVQEISRRLGLDKKTTTTALERLETLGLAKKETHGWTVANGTLSTTHDVPSRHIQEHHTQVMQKAMTALIEVPVKQRDFSTMMFAVEENQIEEAKDFINEFKDKFDLKFGNSKTGDRVYALGVQLFPLDKNI